MTEDVSISSVPLPGDAVVTAGVAVGRALPPPPPSSSDSGAAVASNGARVPSAAGPAGARVTAPAPAGEGPIVGDPVVLAAGVGVALLRLSLSSSARGAVVESAAAWTGEADGLALKPSPVLSTGAGAAVVRVASCDVGGGGDAPAVGPGVEGETEAVVGAGVEADEETAVVAAVPPLEIGSDTASAYDWSPPSTSPLPADTLTVQVPAVTSDAGTTMRSTLLRLSREHDASSPLHIPDLRTHG